ncbi:MAG: MBL fold metallo-hydrolase [Promethearchaeota archaeon]
MSQSEVTITYLGQSGFLLQDGNTNLVLDPGKKIDPSIPIDIIYATHDHFDHVNGIKPILKTNPGAILIGNNQVIKKFKHLTDNLQIAESEKNIKVKSWHLSFFKFRHGIFSNVMNLGLIVENLEFKFGPVGDAVEFKAFYQKNLDILALPISGFFAASPTRVFRELKEFNSIPKTIIPMHWLFRRPRKFCKKLMKKFPDIRCIIPEKGEKLEFCRMEEL